MFFSMLALYYFYLLNVSTDDKDNNKRYLIICLILTFIGVKRIAYLALAVGMLIIFFLSKKGKNLGIKLALWIAIIASSFAIIYIAMIHDGILEKLFNSFGINAMRRFDFWNYFRDKYSLSLNFFGYGISYSHRAMITAGQKALMLHNDVLGIYLGLGFLGSLIYWIWYFYYRARALKNFSREGLIFSVALSVQYFIIFSVCNAGLEPMKNAIVCMLIICIVEKFYNFHKSIKRRIS